MAEDQEIQTAERWGWRRNKIAGYGRVRDRKVSDAMWELDMYQTQACIDLRQERQLIRAEAR